MSKIAPNSCADNIHGILSVSQGHFGLKSNDFVTTVFVVATEPVQLYNFVFVVENKYEYGIQAQ